MRNTCLRQVYELAKRDPRVVFIGSDIGAGTLDEMKRAMPERFFMEGIAEQSVIGMAAGLAMEGFVPYINTIACFLTRRAFEQVAIDVCFHNLPVRLLGSGGGTVYAPLGPTHQVVEDLATMRALPNMSVVAVADANEMAWLMQESLDWPGPMYIRMAKGGDPIVNRDRSSFRIGRAVELKPPGRVGFVTCGILADRCLKAAALLEADGLGAGVLHVHTVKPLDESRLAEFTRSVSLVVTAEEHLLAGGFGSAVLESLSSTRLDVPPVLRLGLPDAFPERFGSQEQTLSRAGLSPDAIAGRVRSVLRELDARPHISRRCT